MALIFLAKGTAAEQVLGAFNQGSACFFWRSEFHGTAKLMERFCRSSYSPSHPPLARRISWRSGTPQCAGWPTIVKHISHPLMGRRTQRTSCPLVYAQLPHRLEQSDLPPGGTQSHFFQRAARPRRNQPRCIGITLTYLMHMLSQRKPLQRTLREELRRSTAFDSAPCTQRDINALPLLDAILMEALRLFSANPGPWPRRVPATGCQVVLLSNIPTDGVVSASSYTLHRNAPVFPHAEEWRPERWLNAGVERRSEMMRWFEAFGSGARICIGRYFAVQSMFGHGWIRGLKTEEWLVMKTLVAAIYTDFETSVVDDSEIGQVNGVLAPPIGDTLLLQLRHVGTGPLP